MDKPLWYRFTAAGSMTDEQFWTMHTNYAHLRFGNSSGEDIGDAVKILALTHDGGRHTIERFTSLSEFEQNSILIRQPAGTKIGIEVEGTPNLYVEFNDYDRSRDDQA